METDVLNYRRFVFLFAFMYTTHNSNLPQPPLLLALLARSHRPLATLPTISDLIFRLLLEVALELIGSSHNISPALMGKKELSNEMKKG